MLGKRQFGILLAGLLLSWLPQAVAASGGAETSASTRRVGALPPSAVFAAFESNLTGPASSVTESKPLQLTNEATASPAERPGTFEIAAAFAQQTEAIFKASLADSNPQALTPPSLSVTPDAIRIYATVGDPAVQRRLEISSLAGTVNWGAEARISNGSGWLSVSSSSGTVDAGTPTQLDVEIDPSALGEVGGLLQGVILITDQATGFVKAVPVSMVLNAQSRIGVNQTSMLFAIAGGGAPPPEQILQIFNSVTQGLLIWSIPASAVPSWLNVSSSSGTAGSIAGIPSSVRLSINGTEALALPSGVYQALLPIESSDASNSPQLVGVTLQRVPGSTPPAPGVGPSGLTFVVPEGGNESQPRTFTTSNLGGGSLSASFNVSTESGGDWLSLSGTGGDITSASGPLSTEVRVNSGNLAPGFYNGTIHGSFSDGGPLDVEVLMVVQPGVAPARPSYPPRAALGGCTPDKMELIAETIGNGASLPISFPKVLLVSLIDSCGELVDDATVVGSAEGNSIPMQGIGGGVYSGTWVPQQQSAEVPVTFAALHPTLPPVQKTFQVSTQPAAEGIQLPVLASDGVVEAAGFTPRRPLAPGGFISLFGERFATETAGATKIPLERELAGVQVRIGGVDAPLHFVSPTQINAQLPVEFEPGADVSIVVSANGVRTAPQSYLVAPAAPGIFIGSSGPAILRFGGEQQGVLVTAENPVRIGDILEIFATGLGATEPAVASGEAGPSFSEVTNPVSVEIGGIGVPVLYQGLAPGFVGLYQVNVQVTPNVPTGDDLQIRIIQDGVISNSEDPAIVRVVQP